MARRGWFFGLRLHVVINHKGHIGRDLFRKLWQRGLHLITGIRRNMQNHLMPLADKRMLRKRFIIETVLDILKCEMGLEHSRHRSVVNAMVHILSCLVAYAFRPGKPSIAPAGQPTEAYAQFGLVRPAGIKRRTSRRRVRDRRFWPSIRPRPIG